MFFSNFLIFPHETSHARPQNIKHATAMHAFPGMIDPKLGSENMAINGGSTHKYEGIGP